MDILIFYEHKARELNNACLLKYELEQRGYRVKITSLYNITTPYLIQPIFFSKPKVVIVPWLYSSDEVKKIKNMFRNADFKLINLQCEQVISEKWIKSGYFFPKGEAQKFLHICWGSKIEDRLIEFGLEKKNLLTLGAVSTDYDQTKFQALMMKKEEIAKQYKLDYNKKWSLFISSFTYTTLTDEELSELYRRTQAEPDEFKDTMQITKKKILGWIVQFLEEDKDTIFIYRPHPGERDDKFIIELSEKYNNFFVINELSVSQWILVSDYINTWFSTSTADSYFLKKAFAILRPYTIPEFLDSELLIDVPYIKDYESFRKFNKGEYISESILFNKRINLYYKYKDEDYVYIRLCDVIEDLLNQNDDSFKLHAEKKGRIKYCMSIICYLTFYFRISRVFNTKKNILEDFEKENYKSNSYIEEYCNKLRLLL